MNKNILRIKPYKPGKPIEEVRRELRIKGPVIKLASNESAFPPSKRVISRIKKGLKSLNRYPDGGCFYLKKAISKKMRVNTENIIIGNGSDELITLALNAFTREGDEVVTAKPTFLVYEIASKIRGLKIKTAPLKNLRYDLKSMAKLITGKTKIVFIANPDNPTGSYVSRKELGLFLKKIKRNTIIFMDEAYYEFARDLKDYPKTMKYFNKKNMIIARTFSKAYSLAGLRVGYGIARKPIIEAMNKVREPFNVNSLAQIAAEEALKDDRFVAKNLSMLKSGKKYLYNNLNLLGLEYIESATNFMLIKIGKKAKDVYNKLLKQGIIVREMGQWGLNGFIRVTVGTMNENKRFIKALKEICR